MSLRQIVYKLTSLDDRGTDVLTPECRTHFDEAIHELNILQVALLGIEEYLASRIHPDLRQKHDRATPKRAVSWL